MRVLRGKLINGVFEKVELEISYSIKREIERKKKKKKVAICQKWWGSVVV